MKITRSQLKELIKQSIKEIRLIEDPHTAVSRGCLSEAQLIEEDENENNG